jgi:protein-S-isoprenylcysteine O-methyltransferase Ste14
LEIIMRTLLLAAAITVSAGGAWLVIRLVPQTQTLVLGGLLIAAGLPLMVLSRRQLGAAFSLGPRAKGLVTHGLYARIPHPMYVFLDLCLLGALIVLRQAWFLGIWLALICVQLWQARREVRVLEAAFGDAYREYRRRTWW